MMRFATLLLCVSACSSDPAEQAVLLVSERTAPELPVAFETMDRLLGARVPIVAHPGDTVEVLVDLQWSSTPPDEVELTLWKAGGSEPVLAEVLGIENAQSGQAQGIVWSPTLSSGFEEGAYWVMLRLRTSQGVVEADAFSNGWVMLGMTWVIPSGHLLPPTPLPAPELPADEARGLLAVGGDLNAGRRQNGISGARGLDEAFSRLALFRDADLGYANLESVISDVGEQGVEKGEDAPFYYRGRPEQAGLLVHAGIDVVGTANNHSGDYGPEALLRQAELLDLAGVVGVGSGRTRTEACEARYAWAGPIRVGFVAIDTTQKRFAADAENPGACFVDLENLTGGHGEWAQAIAAAKNQADVVVAGVHWGKNNRSRPVRETREFAHTLIAAGADAVLGSSAHRLQGVEVFRGKPILYDAGNLLFDSHLSGEAARSAVFNLTLTTRGVHRIEVVPISVGYGRVSEASDNLAARVLRRFRLLSAELGTPTRVVGERVWIDLPVQRGEPNPERDHWPNEPKGEPVFRPASQPPEDCVVEQVPEQARLENPVTVGPYELLGLTLEPSELQGRGLVWMESYWRIKAPTEDRWVATRLVAEDQDPKKMWWADHELCDWMWPSSRWTVGTIYRDRYSIRPPSVLPAGSYQIVLAAMKEDSDPTGFGWRGPAVVVQ